MPSPPRVDPSPAPPPLLPFTRAELALIDTLDTARSFGLDGERVELSYERFSEALLHDSGDPDAGSKDWTSFARS